MFFLIILTLFFGANVAQIPMAKPCNLTGMENLNRTLIMGRWYEYLRYPLAGVQSRCETDDFAENPDGTGNLTTAFLPLNATSRNEIIVMRETMHFSGSNVMLTPLLDPPFPRNCTFISTDYESYLIKAACVVDHPNNLYNYWIFGRSKEPSQSVLEKINQVLKDEDIPEQYFQVMNQTNCDDFYM